MTTFDQRELGFEARFAHDEEMRFKIDAYRNKSFGLWAAHTMGLSDSDSAEYAEKIVKVGVDTRGAEKVIERVASDLWGAGIPTNADELRLEFHRREVEAQNAVGAKT